MPKKKQDAEPFVYQLKLTLQGIKPPIWRRVLVPSDATLYRLHQVIQVAMDWDNYHLHEFKVGRTRYGQPDDEWSEDTREETEFTLAEVLGKRVKKLEYMYDFGDSWMLKIDVEKHLPLDADKTYPVCLGGKRHGPAEDSGGTWGYTEKLRVLGDPGDPDYGEVVEWLGEDWDAEAFDLKAINEALQNQLDDLPPVLTEEYLNSLSEDEREAVFEEMMEQDPFMEERIGRLQAKVAKVHGLQDREAVDNFIKNMKPEAFKEFAQQHMVNDPEEAAHEFGWLALSDVDVEEMRGYADTALRLDPSNVDAHIALGYACLAEERAAEGVALLRRALSLAEEKLATVEQNGREEAFGSHWEVLPCLRAHFALGRSLMVQHMVTDAVKHFEAMLTMDTDDVTGARYYLVGALLQSRDLENARRHLDEVRDADDLVLPWGRVLERFLSGDLEGAEAHLEKAIEANPLTASLLLDPDSVDDLEDESEEESAARICVSSIGFAWRDHKDAMRWLSRFVFEEDLDGED